MSAIREAPGRCVVAVVGAGHVGGMVGYLHTPVDRDALSQIPPPSALRRASHWLVPAFGVLALALGAAERPAEVWRQMLIGLFAIHLLCVVALGSVARAAPLALVAAALASPLLAFIPRADAGQWAAFLQARSRPPEPADREGLSQISSPSDWYANRFTRVLLVGFLVSIASAVAAVLGVSWLWLARG